MTDNAHPEDDLASQLAPLTIARQAAEPGRQENEFAAVYAARLAALPASYQKKVRARVMKASINPSEESGALDSVFAEYTAQYQRKKEASRLGAARRREAKRAAIALEASAAQAEAPATETETEAPADPK